MVSIAELALKCLCEIANVRITIFENAKLRTDFVNNFVINIINLL